MRNKSWGTYKPSKDKQPETHALRQLRMMTYDAAMGVSAVCLKRKLDGLQARIRVREIELEEAKQRESFAHDCYSDDRPSLILDAQAEVERAEIMLMELTSQMEGAIGAAIDRGLIEFDD